MKKIGILVCRNGLGHIRRILQIVDFLLSEEKKINIDIFFDFKQKELLCNWKIINKLEKNKNVKFFNFAPYPFWPINFNNLDTKKLLKWHKSIKELKLEKFDLVISDNLVEPIKYNKNTILSGSFLWHQVYLKAFKDVEEIKVYYKNSSEILKKYKPQMIVNRYFYMPSLEREVNIIKVGMLKSLKKNLRKKKNKIGVLFSYSAEGTFIEKFKKIEENKSFDGFEIYLDKRTYSSCKNKNNFKFFDYDKDGFSKIHALIGVASIGTITESFGTSTPLFFFKSKNPEIDHNSKILKKMSLGFEINSFEEAFRKIRLFYKNKYDLKFKNNLKKIDKNGLKQTLNIIKKFL